MGAGAAAAEAERRKRLRYLAQADAVLVAVRPLVVESYGRLGPEALGILREARQRVAERSGEQAARSSGVSNRWCSQLQCQLLWAQHEAVAAMIAASAAPLGLASVEFARGQ